MWVFFIITNLCSLIHKRIKLSRILISDKRFHIGCGSIYGPYDHLKFNSSKTIFHLQQPFVSNSNITPFKQFPIPKIPQTDTHLSFFHTQKYGSKPKFRHSYVLNNEWSLVIRTSGYGLLKIRKRSSTFESPLAEKEYSFPSPRALSRIFEQAWRREK